ncbi:hypothetical protein N7527_008262 [Penicillium freii]|nr:hypothetical protein N7527_008262 [Penicillium freii]
METGHRAQHETQVADTNALLMTIDNKEDRAGKESSGPTDGHRYIEFGQRVEDSRATVVPPGRVKGIFDCLRNPI